MDECNSFSGLEEVWASRDISLDLRKAVWSGLSSSWRGGDVLALGDAGAASLPPHTRPQAWVHTVRTHPLIFQEHSLG